jgi:uncharacterized membrane protein
VKPLLFANWQHINRVFCVSIWIVAVALALVIVMHVAQPASACAARPGAPATSVCTVAGPQGHVRRH